MEWIESKILTTHDAIELITYTLLNCGIESIQIEDDIDLKHFLDNNYLDWDYVDDELANKKIEDTIITFYLSKNAYGYELLNTIKSSLEIVKKETNIDIGKFELLLKDVDEKDWVDNWKKYYKPFKIGNNIVIRPYWEQYEKTEKDIVFTIDPGNAFGTGLHQTTQLCILALETIIKPNTKVLDLGCGSGVLSIISMLLGAQSAFAIDIDNNAVDATMHNAKLNNIIDNFIAVAGNVITDTDLNHKVKQNKYEVIVANIVSDVIINLLPLVKELITNDGTFITSGIIKSRSDEVISKLEQHNFKVIKINEKDEWISIICQNSL